MCCIVCCQSIWMSYFLFGCPIFYFDGGYQELEIIGRGDTNNDDIEDVIVVVHDYLDGGNYMNIRLLVLSVDKQNNWQLIKSL